MQPCFWIMSPQSFHWVTTPSRRQYHAARSFQFSGGHRMPWWHLHLLFCILPDKEFPVRGLLSTFSSQSILCMRRCCQKVFLMTALSPTTQSWLVACRPQFLNAGAFYSLVGKCPTPFLSLCVAGCVHVWVSLLHNLLSYRKWTANLLGLGHTLLADAPFFRGVD